MEKLVARYRKLNTNIWRDKQFRALTAEEACEIIRQIVFDEPNAFIEYAGPYFNVREEGPRRTELSSAQWRRLRQEVLDEQGTLCAYCGKDCSARPTVDHVMAVSRGGAVFDKANLVVCCRPCNSSKRDREGWA